MINSSKRIEKYYQCTVLYMWKGEIQEVTISARNKIYENLKNSMISTVLILLLGVILGVFSKWLDNLSIDSTVWWQNILEILDLRNVFSLFGIWIFIAVAISVFSKTLFKAAMNVYYYFFVGMITSYHLCTIYFCGFNPLECMKIWYGITLITPAFSYICWYAKGISKVSIIISSLILCVMFISSFSIGMCYFDVKSVVDLLIFIVTVLVLYKNPKNSIYSLIITLFLAFIICTIL